MASRRLVCRVQARQDNMGESRSGMHWLGGYRRGSLVLDSHGTAGHAPRRHAEAVVDSTGLARRGSPSSGLVRQRWTGLVGPATLRCATVAAVRQGVACQGSARKGVDSFGTVAMQRLGEPCSTQPGSVPATNQQPLVYEVVTDGIGLASRGKRR